MKSRGSPSTSTSRSSSASGLRTSDVQHAIAQLVDYLQVDGFNNFSGEPDHIFHAVRTVRDWLGWPGKLDNEDAIVAELAQAHNDQRLAAATATVSAKVAS